MFASLSISARDFRAFVLFSLLASQGSATVPSIANWTLVFSDDFNGSKGSLPNTKRWLFDIGTQYSNGSANWGTGEIETMTKSTQNVALNGAGELHITPVKTSSGWTSARIETVADNFAVAAGKKLRIQGSIALPNVNQTTGMGYWPAFWTLGAPFRNSNGSIWPSTGEWDLMENVNGLNFASQTMHCGVIPGGPCNEPYGLGESGSCVGSACQGNFHTYTAILDRSVTPETLSFYVDGVVNNVVKSSSMPATTWANATHRGTFIILNVAMGGAYPDGVAGFTTPTNQTVSGVPMRVDYVAVYKQ